MLGAMTSLTGGGGMSASGGTQTSSNENRASQSIGGHIFNFGPPVETGMDGINFNQIAMYGLAAVVLVIALRK